MSEDPTKRLPSRQNDLIAELIDLVRSINARLDILESKFEALKQTVEQRLYDTRPMWQEALARLDRIESRMGSLENRMDGLETRIDKFETSINNNLKDLRRAFRSQYADVIRGQEDFDERLTELEQRSA